MPVSRSTEVGDEGAGGGAAEKAVGVASRRRTTRRLKRGARSLCQTGGVCERCSFRERERETGPGGDDPSGAVAGSGGAGRRAKQRVRARGLAVSVAAPMGGVGQEEGEDSGVTALLT